MICFVVFDEFWQKSCCVLKMIFNINKFRFVKISFKICLCFYVARKDIVAHWFCFFLIDYVCVKADRNVEKFFKDFKFFLQAFCQNLFLVSKSLLSSLSKTDKTKMVCLSIVTMVVLNASAAIKKFENKYPHEIQDKTITTNKVALKSENFFI